jgi:uncharacterized protein (DUF1330 family)
MSSLYKLALAGLVGVVLGATGMDAIYAQTAVAPAFLVANIQDVKDQASYDKYRAAVVGTQMPYGARFLARGAKAVALDNSPLPQGTVSIIVYPSMKSLRDWWNSAGYSAIRPLRESATVGNLYAVEGLPPS